MKLIFLSFALRGIWALTDECQFILLSSCMNFQPLAFSKVSIIPVYIFPVNRHSMTTRRIREDLHNVVR